MHNEKHFQSCVYRLLILVSCSCLAKQIVLSLSHAVNAISNYQIITLQADAVIFTAGCH